MVALAKVMSLQPKILMLDEPTKGLDANTKLVFAGILQSLREQGVSILVVTHDAEFACTVADRCALCFQGEICGTDETRKFFSENSFYTTTVNRITRGYFKDCVTLEDAAYALGLQIK